MKNSECDGKTKNHLNDLETCGEDGKHLGDFDPHRPEGVVGVHDRVHNEVHDNEPSRWSRVLAEWVPAVDKDCDVVVPMQKYQFLFPQNDKYCVAKLGNLQ